MGSGSCRGGKEEPAAFTRVSGPGAPQRFHLVSHSAFTPQMLPGDTKRQLSVLGTVEEKCSVKPTPSISVEYAENS